MTDQVRLQGGNLPPTTLQVSEMLSPSRCGPTLELSCRPRWSSTAGGSGGTATQSSALAESDCSQGSTLLRVHAGIDTQNTNGDQHSGLMRIKGSDRTHCLGPQEADVGEGRVPT